MIMLAMEDARRQAMAAEKTEAIVCPACHKVRRVGPRAARAALRRPAFCRSCSRKPARAKMVFARVPCRQCGRLFERASGNTKTCPACKPAAIGARPCQVCGTLYTGYRNKLACSVACRIRLRRNLTYFGGRQFQAVGWEEKICQLCGRHTPKRAHVHHVYSHPNHKALIVLCAGCHDEVSKLARRPGFGPPQFEMLVRLVYAQRSGHERWIIQTKVEELTPEEWESWLSVGGIALPPSNPTLELT